jgi:HYR domain
MYSAWSSRYWNAYSHRTLSAWGYDRDLHRRRERHRYASASFTVTVQDTTAPALANAPPISVEVTAGATNTAVNFAEPTAIDVVDGLVPVSCSPPSGSVFSIGTTTVTCTATDIHGNTATTSFPVTVVAQRHPRPRRRRHPRRRRRRPPATLCRPARSRICVSSQPRWYAFPGRCRGIPTSITAR